MLSKRLAPRGLAKRTTTIRKPRHTFSTSSSVYSNDATTSAASIASEFLSRFQSQGPQVRTQVLDANQLQLLSLTLNRPTLYPESPHLSSASPPPPGTPIPPGHHLIYFTPAFLESELGADGTDTSYNPFPPFTRRMWAGGEVSWRRRGDNNGKPNLLRVGQTVSETTKVLSAEPKVVRKTGEAMIVVGVEKTLANEEGVAVVDRRWVLFFLFLTEL
jgi:hydroxyacyl-ACP dehydratase HTD2-like protein with hotdog domain